MDLFKQNLAPIASEAWEEITQRAEAVIKSVLSARKALHVVGPFGAEKTSVSTGRMQLLKNDESGVKTGVYENLSLIESRINFDLSRWELDNILRGAKDIDLEPLENAALKLAEFEEKTLFYGNKNAKIAGLVASACHSVDLGSESQAILEGIANAVLHLEAKFSQKPYTLLVSEKLMQAMNKIHGAKILREIVESVIGGKVILAKGLEGGLLMPNDHEDLELVLGQDYTIGYQHHDSQSVQLFIMLSFLPRVIDNQLLVHFRF
jgi:uncharacterized linocin/CFP29 family protein